MLNLTNLGDLKRRADAILPRPMECIIDLYNISMNAILEIPIEEYEKSLEEEEKTKIGLTVSQNTQ